MIRIRAAVKTIPSVRTSSAVITAELRNSDASGHPRWRFGIPLSRMNAGYGPIATEIYLAAAQLSVGVDRVFEMNRQLP